MAYLQVGLTPLHCRIALAFDCCIAAALDCRIASVSPGNIFSLNFSTNASTAVLLNFDSSIVYNPGGNVSINGCLLLQSMFLIIYSRVFYYKVFLIQ